MGYAVVFVLSVGVGWFVYTYSLRRLEAEPAAVGFEPGEAEPEPEQDAEPAAPPGYTYLQVALTRGPSLRQRLQGFVGSIVLVVIAAMAVAGALYGVGAMLDRIIRSFLNE